MALTYFLNASNVKVDNANAYATLLDVDNHLIAKSVFQLWDIKEDDDKERMIESITERLDTLDFKGVINETGQSLKFPRKDFYDTGDARATEFYGIEAQKKSLKAFIAIQLEAELQKGSISQTNIEQGEEKVEDISFEFHKNAYRKIQRWVR